MRLLLLLLFVGAASLAPPAAAEPPLNVVLLYADDWRHDTLGVAGHPVVQTPNLDALAARGVRFTQNRVTTAVCGVSRANLLTGQWASRNGCSGFNRFTTPWEQTLPGVMRDAGFHVGHVGKWHNGKFPADEYDFGRSYFGKHWYKREDGSPVHVTQRNEEDALAFLRTRPEGKPFLLLVNFFATHAEDSNPEQFLPQPGSMELYADQEMPVPPNATQASLDRLPEFLSDEANEGRNRWHWRFDTPEKFQRMMRNYYRLATEVDAVCGRILAELDEQGVRGETLVVFTTDNGYYHAEHGLADKWYPHAESVRVPLIVDDPRAPLETRGTVNEAMTLSVDLAPTLIAAGGAVVPEGMQGRDLTPLLRTPEQRPTDWRTEYFYEHPTLRNPSFIPSSQALIRRDWKLTFYPDFDRHQLFDMEADPREEDDLIDDPAHAERLEEMKARLAELRAEAA